MVGGDERQKIDGERTIRANPYHLHLLYGCNRHASMSTSPIFSGDTIGVQLCVEATLTEYATFEIQVPHLVTYPVMVGRAVRHGAAPRSEMGTSSVSGVGTMLPFQLATRERRTYRARARSRQRSTTRSNLGSRAFKPPRAHTTSALQEHALGAKHTKSSNHHGARNDQHAFGKFDFAI